MIKKGTEYGSFILFLIFIGLIVVIFYNYLTTPNFKPLPLLVVVFWLMVSFLFEFGEYLGRFIKKKNFITMGGLTGVYHYHISHGSGMSEYFFSTQKRYGDFLGNRDYQEQSLITRFFLRFTNSRMFSIIDHDYLFEEVEHNLNDTDEGAIIYYGTFKHQSKLRVPSFGEILQVKLNQAYAIISEFATIAEKAKALSEQTAQSQQKDIVDAVIKVGTAIQNLPIQQPNYPQQQQGRF